MHILVTGGAGFIGSHFCDRFIARGDSVSVLDDLSTGSLDNLAQHVGAHGFAFEDGSVTDAARLFPLVEEADAVVHLAALVGVRQVLARPVETLETNVEGARLVFSAAARRRIPVLYASSSEVYGQNPRAPFREDAELGLGAPSPNGWGRWAYATSKAMGEWLAQAQSCAAGLPVVVARLFNTVGPRQSGRHGMVLPTLVRQALAGEPLTVHGDGSQTRAFAHVRDTVDACLALLAGPGATGRVFNVGGTEETTMGDLARLVRRVARSSSPIVHVPRREAYGTEVFDPVRRVPDVSRLRACIGGVPSTPLEVIVEDVVRAARARPAELRAGRRA